MNFEVEEKQAMMDQMELKYTDAEIDKLDGVTIQYENWWFNCRPSNTEPLLRLNIEAGTPELLDERLSEIGAQLGQPVLH